MKKTEIWSFIGAGGKSTLILLTGAEKARQGKRVLVTATTHTAFTTEDLERAGGILLLGGDGTLAAAALERYGFAAAVREADMEPGRQQGLSEGELEKAMRAADLVLVEADGSRRRPFKAPAEYEPAVHPASSRILLIAGLTALDAPIKENCHRTEEIIRLTGRNRDQILRTEDMAAVIREGYLEKCSRLWPGVPVTVILNQADTRELREKGMEVQKLLSESAAEVYLFSVRTFWKGKERWNMN